ncbi:SGNH/GDSL hydrolase family protein [soil metagenome]
MPVILCYGDSNTWGSDPETGSRFAPSVRWTGVLASQLGPGFTVIEEGLNGRTTNLEDGIEEHRDGRSYLPACLESHRPFDVITIMLGTNDLKERFHRSASDIAQSAAALGTLARRSGCGIAGAAPEVLLIAPPPLTSSPGFSEMLAGGIEKSERFGERYAFFANRYGLHFLDAGIVIESSPIDGVHFQAAEHHKLGLAVADRIREITG